MHSITTAATTNNKLWAPGYPEIGASYRTVGATCPMSCLFNPAHRGMTIDEAIAKFGPGVEYAQIGECYADKGRVGIWSRKAAMLDSTNWGKLAGKGLVRVNVSGDILGHDGSLDTEYLAGLAATALSNPETRYWLYTHAWQDLMGYPALPSNIEVLASVNTESEYRLAKNLGYRTARATNNPGALHRGEVVCPEQTGKSPACVACGLCPGRKATKQGNWVDLQVRPDIVFILH